MSLSNLDSSALTTSHNNNNNNHTKTDNEQHYKSSPSATIVATTTPTTKPEIEIEQKFALPTAADVTAVETKLRSLGYHLRKKEVFVDWYFDLPSPSWYLTPNDCWLRYRQRPSNGDDDDDDDEVVVGEWQYKRRPITVADRDGTKTTAVTASAAATVYEELTGAEAIDAALAVIRNRPPSPTRDDNSDDDAAAAAAAAAADVTTKKQQQQQQDEDDPKFDNVPPGLLKDSGLVPFAKFETRRSKWIMRDDETTTTTQRDDNHEVLTVDIDGTDFGYMVGEVEIIVHDESEIDEARERIKSVIAEIIGSRNNGDEEDMDKGGDDNDGGGGGGGEEGDTTTAIGKLQTYMVTHCREQYDKCVNAGSL